MKVERLPSSGETLLGTGYRLDYGGKGSNQAVACARLGAHVSLLAMLGNDTFGDMAHQLYGDEGVHVDHVTRTSEAPTGVGFIVVEAASGKNCIVLDPGANELLSGKQVAECRAAFAGSKVVLTQLEIPVEAAAAALQAGLDVGAITILNPAPVRPLPDSVLKLVDVLTPNETEAKVLAGIRPETEANPEALVKDLQQRGVKQVVITLGEMGALIATESAIRRVPALRMNAVDTTGAGDAFNGGLATALAFGADLDEAVEFAIVTGGLAVTKEGVVPALPRRKEVQELCHQRGIALPKWFGAEITRDRKRVVGEPA
jgi:ribokinase